MARKSFQELAADLLVAFPDNNTKLITPAILRNYWNSVFDAIKPAYAILDRTAGVVQAVTTLDTPVVFTSADITSANGEMTAVAASGTVGRVDKGTTRFNFTADALAAANTNKTLVFTLYKDGAPTVWAQSMTLSTNTITESLSFTMLVYTPTAASYSMRVKSTIADNITFSNMVLIAEIVPVNAY